ncbi:hypothetical protein IMSAGC019_01621 [Lachnospiraceae bacterium]|nr:hypothetical protein IMSAGC019_01621 [Lachnospiraceae bacterium]
MVLRVEVKTIDSLRNEEAYTIEDIYALPDGKRAELIDGKIYYMAPPNTKHQRLVSDLHYIFIFTFYYFSLVTFTTLLIYKCTSALSPSCSTSHKIYF